MRRKLKSMMLLSVFTVFMLVFGVVNAQDLREMEDIPNGNCLSCDNCSGHYYLCESDEVNAVFDIMDNCGPNSNVSVTLIDGC